MLPAPLQFGRIAFFREVQRAWYDLHVRDWISHESNAYRSEGGIRAHLLTTERNTIFRDLQISARYYPLNLLSCSTDFTRGLNWIISSEKGRENIYIYIFKGARICSRMKQTGERFQRVYCVTFISIISERVLLRNTRENLPRVEVHKLANYCLSRKRPCKGKPIRLNDHAKTAF